MRLGDLIEALERMPKGALVQYSNGDIPGRFDSWRGVYAHLTLTPDGYGITVEQLLNEARFADGGTFEGYKGGEYTMSRDTPVWADPYGDSLHYGITGCELVDDTVILIRSKIPWEYQI